MPIALLYAAESSGPAERIVAGGPDLTRYLFVCAGLIVFVLAAGWAARRFLSGTLRTRASQRSMQVLDVLPLGNKHRLGVVRCNDRSFLIGFGEGGVRLLTELETVASASEGLSEEQRRIFTTALQRAAGTVGVGRAGSSAKARPAAARPAAQPARAAATKSSGVLA